MAASDHCPGLALVICGSVCVFLSYQVLGGGAVTLPSAGGIQVLSLYRENLIQD